MAKEMTLYFIRRIYTEMKNDATKEEIRQFVNQMMIEVATEHWYYLKNEKERKQNKTNA